MTRLYDYEDESYCIRYTRYNLFLFLSIIILISKYHIAIAIRNHISYPIVYKMKLIRAALILLHVVSTYGHGQEGVEDVVKIDDDDGGRVLGKAGGKAPKVKKDECQRRVDKLEARLMKLEAALAGGEEEEAEEEEEEEDRGGSGRGGIFGDGEGMSPRTHCGCDPKVCTMDVLNREIEGSKLADRITWLLSDPQAVLQGKQLDSPIDACIQVCEIDYPGACDECNPLRSKSANVPWEVLQLPSSCNDYYPPSYDPGAPENQRINYRQWRRCKGCIYVQDGTIDPDDIVTFSSIPDKDLLTQLAHSMGVDIISPKLLPKIGGANALLNYEYQFSNLWQGDFITPDDSEHPVPFGTYAESNRLFDYRNIKCCVDKPTKLGDFECQPDDEDFALLIRGSSLKNSMALWYTPQYRERLMSEIQGGISTCVSTFIKATTDEIFKNAAKAIDNDNSVSWQDLLFKAFSVGLLFFPVVGEGFMMWRAGEFVAQTESETVQRNLQQVVDSVFSTETKEGIRFKDWLKKAGTDVLAPGLQIAADTVQEQVDYSIMTESSVIRSSIEFTDQVMNTVFRTAKRVIRSLHNMSNVDLMVAYGYLFGDYSSCSLSNVTSVISWLDNRFQNKACATYCYWDEGNFISRGKQSSIYLDFSGLCKRNNMWYIATWGQFLSWTSTYGNAFKKYDCQLIPPQLKEEDLLERVVPEVVGQNVAFKQVVDKGTKFDPTVCHEYSDTDSLGLRWPSDVECWYSELDAKEGFPFVSDDPIYYGHALSNLRKWPCTKFPAKENYSKSSCTFSDHSWQFSPVV